MYRLNNDYSNDATKVYLQVCLSGKGNTNPVSRNGLNGIIHIIAKCALDFIFSIWHRVTRRTTELGWNKNTSITHARIGSYVLALRVFLSLVAAVAQARERTIYQINT